MAHLPRYLDLLEIIVIIKILGYSVLHINANSESRFEFFLKKFFLVNLDIGSDFKKNLHGHTIHG